MLLHCSHLILLVGRDPGMGSPLIKYYWPMLRINVLLLENSYNILTLREHYIGTKTKKIILGYVHTAVIDKEVDVFSTLFFKSEAM